MQKRERARKKSKIQKWKKEEVKKMVEMYRSGSSRKEIADILRRTEGSVANKVRLLITEGVLSYRRIQSE